jgi:GDPmannose 4,6-dehydratase
MKKILVTGILGQDGSSMANYLLNDSGEDVRVYGMMRRLSTPNYINTESFSGNKNFEFVCGDLSDAVSINNLVKDIQPDYFVNFGANSFVGCSWDMPIQVFDVNALGVVRCLEAIRKHAPECRFYSAGSSEEMGDVDYSPQDLKHPIKPRSPYAASKAAARHIVKVYRESYDMFAVHGILFNHEGIRRGEEFVTRKITKGVARIYWDMQRGNKITPIELGNLYSVRDWSDADDFVTGVWLMLNQQHPKDYILSSNECHSIKEFVSKAFGYAHISGSWTEIEGDELSTKFVLNLEHYQLAVKVNPKYYRPAEVAKLWGDSSLAREELGWSPKTTFDQLVKKMVNWDIEKEKHPT